MHLKSLFTRAHATYYIITMSTTTQDSFKGIVGGCAVDTCANVAIFNSKRKSL